MPHTIMPHDQMSVLWSHGFPKCTSGLRYVRAEISRVPGLLTAPRSASLTLISRGFSFGFSLSNPLMPTFSILRSVSGQFTEIRTGVSDD